MMDYGLQGKTAIVTGGASGMGAATVELLMGEGCNVVIADYADSEDGNRMAEKLTAEKPAKAIFVRCDVSSEDDDKNAFETALKEFGQVDILANIAGVWPTAYVKDMEASAFRKTLEINLIGPFLLSRSMVNYCLENDRKGKIINMVSQAAFHGSTSGHAHYAASKAALANFTVSLAREVAPKGITVTAVAPGIVETPMMTEKLKDPAAREAYLERIPLRRIATREDVAKIVCFLASSQADYLTGMCIDATGGMLMR